MAVSTAEEGAKVNNGAASQQQATPSEKDSSANDVKINDVVAAVRTHKDVLIRECGGDPTGMTIAGYRDLLEKDMNLKPGDLHPFTTKLSDMIDAVYKKHAEKQIQEEEAREDKKRKRAKLKEEEAAAKQVEEKKAEGKKAEEEKKGKSDNPLVAALKQLLAVAKGSSVPYLHLFKGDAKKNKQLFKSKLEELLAKEGLNAASSKEEIAAVKKRLETAKDLEGIDSGNIITSKRKVGEGEKAKSKANTSEVEGAKTDGNKSDTDKVAKSEVDGDGAKKSLPQKKARLILDDEDEEW